MRSGILLVLWSACGFSAHLDGAGDDGSGDEIKIVDDSRDDFGDGRVTDGIFALPGSIEPDGFVLGGLHARGFAAALVNPGDTFDVVLADAGSSTQSGAGYAQVPTNWTQSRPKGLGLGTDTNFTVIYDGEILLPKGSVTLEADADDRALVQVALDHDNPTAFGQLLVASSTGSGPNSMAVVVPEAGWYPIRAAITEDTGNARMVLTLVQGPVKTLVDGNRLRARVTNDRGLIAYVFDGAGFIGANGATARSTVDDAFGFGAPTYDLTGSFDRFSLRFAGQLRIDAKAMYTFTTDVGIDASDEWRLWIDGQPIAGRWRGNAVPSADVNLDEGWHDILVDYQDDIGNAEVHVKMNGATLDPAHLRPVVVFGNTFAAVQPAATTIADHAITFVQLPPLAGDVLTLIDAVDVGFQIDNQDMTTLTLDLYDCNGPKPLTVNPIPSYHYFGGDKGCAGKTTKPPAPWSLRLNDTQVGNSFFIGLGQVREYGMAALYHGGPKMPYSPVVTYTSGPRATPRATRITSVKAKGDFDGAAVEVAVRTAADAAALEAAEWEVLDDDESFVGNAFAQYRVTMTTNGWQYPVLDKVEIVYVTPSP